MVRAVLVVLAVFPAPAQVGFPASGESLHYTVNWPSGLSLGEGHLTAARSQASAGAQDRWEFQFTLDAPVPGFKVADRYRARASADFCSCDLEKELSHGARKSSERTVFHPTKRVAERTTAGGGSSEISTPLCARDALTFVYYARRELSQGRLPPGESVLFGARYQVRLEYTGRQPVSLEGQKAEADRVTAHLKGPSSETTLELYFARDAARTPLLIRVPLSLGTFSMELVR